ncbi:MAG: sugar isomerase, partial [Thermogutta sp.]|nr:sugar isomerase [Thermogutta sp.]
AEVARINGELQALQSKADFPLEIAPVTATRNAGELAALPDVQQADALLVYACDGDLNQIAALKKDTVFFLRHKSGPVYLHYEIISPRFLRQHTDELKVPGMDNDDVVVDDYEEVLWRLRALCGLKNTRNARIVAVGGAGGWAQPSEVITDLVKKVWGLEIMDVAYPDLKKMIEDARADAAAVALAEKRTEEYLRDPHVSLETDRAFLRNAFLLEHVFRKIMQQADCRMLTVNQCMGTIMPVAETTACMPLSTLNDDGYLAFCESDFVVIPSGILMASISGRPPFLNDPTYPHHGIITLAHCTAPRKMNGRDPEPVRVMTHFESDYGAAPKVEMSNGTVVTNILPDFQSRRWVGLLGEIVAHPLLPICRSQIDIAFQCDSKLLADRMPGFHWMTVYGNYLKEAAYAAKRVGIQVEILG